MIDSNAKISRQKFGVFTLLFLELFGAGFMVFGLLFINMTKIDPNWVRTQGEVIDIIPSYDNRGGEMFSPVLKYSINGQNYQFTRNWSSADRPTIGAKEKVAYNPSMPGQAKAVESMGGLAILFLFVLVGIVCVITAPVFFIKSLRRSGLIKNLMQKGEKLSGVIVRVKSVGGPGGRRSSINHYKITVSVADKSGITQEYISDPINSYADLTVIDFDRNQIPADVYVNPVDSKQYYVDVDSIPDLTALSRDAFMQLAKK